MAFTLAAFDGGGEHSHLNRAAARYRQTILPSGYGRQTPQQACSFKQAGCVAYQAAWRYLAVTPSREGGEQWMGGVTWDDAPTGGALLPVYTLPRTRTTMVIVAKYILLYDDDSMSFQI